jgi:hypothetical protein
MPALLWRGRAGGVLALVAPVAEVEERARGEVGTGMLCISRAAASPLGAGGKEGGIKRDCCRGCC